MAAIRYFKKPANAPDPGLGNGSKVVFTTIDNLFGYFATDNEYVQQSLIGFISSGTGGITEIPAEEFVRDYMEPKKNGVRARPLWREEVGAQGAVQRGIPVMQQLGQERVQQAAAVVVDKSQLPPEAGAAGVAVNDPNKPGPGPTQPDLRSQVKVGKRTPKREKAPENKPS